jgi:hypothetical protein
MTKSRCCRAHTLTDIQLMEEIQHRVRFQVSVRLNFQSRRLEKTPDYLAQKLCGLAEFFDLVKHSEMSVVQELSFIRQHDN